MSDVAGREDNQEQRGRADIPGTRPVSPGAGQDSQGRANIPGTREVTPAPPSAGERAGALATGVQSGMIESLPMVGGGLGALLGAPGGPGTSAVGMTLGMAAGESLRQGLRGFGAPTVSELPPEVRPFGFAGEVVGAGGPAAGAPFAAAGRRAADDLVGRLINRVIESAERGPGAFAVAETGSLGMAGLGEGVAEEVRPGETGTRLLSGIVGGFLSPSRWIAQGSGTASDLVRRAWTSMSDDAKNTRAGQTLREIIVEAGEDPDELARRLRESDEFAAQRTAAQLTGSPALQAIEADLARSSVRFGRESEQRARNALDEMRSAIAALEATGDPQAMRRASQIRDEYFRRLLDGRVAEAQRRMVEAAEGITEDTPQTRAELSRRSTEIIEESLSQARDAEKQLWRQVPQDAEAFGDNISAAANRFATEELLPEEGLPDLVKRFTDRIAENDNATTIRELQIFRSRMLDKARVADRNGEAAEARLFGQLAESALDDMAEVEGLGEAHDTARQFSRQLNDTFTRTFAGQAISTGRTGARRIPPEALAKRALGTGNELAAMRLREMENAVQMGSPEALNEMLDIQQRLIRLAANDAVDPETGVVNANRLARFRRDNAELLGRFPELEAIFSDAQRAKRFFDETTARANQGRKVIQQEAAFSRVAQSENPIQEVNNVLMGNSPERDFRNLARTAEKVGSDAVAGLRRATFDEAFGRAGGVENFDFTAYRRALFNPRRAGQRSPIELMRRNGVIDEATVNRLQRLLDEGEKITRIVRNRSELDELLGEENAAFDFFLRLAGAQAGEISAVSGASGSTLVVAGAGSRALRRVLDKIPRARVKDVIIEAAQNPPLMATLLQRARTQKEKIRIARQMNAHLWQAGLIRGPRQMTEQGREEPSMQEPVGP